MTHGSLFSGIGGFDLGFERAGIKTVWQVEIDEYCRKILEQHFPDVERRGDIQLCCGKNGDAGNHRFQCNYSHLEWVDVVTGGFPCQDISDAGQRVGIDGERSGLWREMRRLIDELSPRFVVVENVSALLGRGVGRVLGDLAALGYDAEWDCLPACAFGAPHRRDRVFIISYPSSVRRERHNRISERQQHLRWRNAQCESESLCDNVADPAEQRLQSGQFVKQQTDAAKTPRRLESKSQRRSSLEFGKSWWATEPTMGRVANGIPDRMDRLKGLGNSLVPQIAEWIGRRILEAGDFAGDAAKGELIARSDDAGNGTAGPLQSLGAERREQSE